MYTSILAYRDDHAVVEIHNIDPQRRYLNDPLIPNIQTLVVPRIMAIDMTTSNIDVPQPLTWHGDHDRQQARAFELMCLLIDTEFPGLIYLGSRPDDVLGNTALWNTCRQVGDDEVSGIETTVPLLWDRYIRVEEFPALQGRVTCEVVRDDVVLTYSKEVWPAGDGYI